METANFLVVALQEVGDTGPELPAKTSGKIAIDETSGAKSGAHGAESDSIDHDLASIIEAWSGLSDEAKGQILNIIDATHDRT